MTLSVKQTMLMKVIADGGIEPGEEYIDLDQVIDELERRYGWKTSKASLQFSVRSMMKRGMLEKMPQERRRGRSRIIFRATDLAKHFVSIQEPAIEPYLQAAGLRKNMHGVKGDEAKVSEH